MLAVQIFTARWPRTPAVHFKGFPGARAFPGADPLEFIKLQL